jgi:hypothetical protein
LACIVYFQHTPGTLYLSALDDWDTMVGNLFDRDYPGSAGTVGYPAVDIREEKERYVLEAELPGLAEKDVSIKVNDRILTIESAKQEEKKAQQDGVWLIRERAVCAPSAARSACPGMLTSRQSRPASKTACLRSIFPNGRKPGKKA